MAQLLTWTDEGRSYAWDGVCLSAVDPDGRRWFVAPTHGLGASLRELVAESDSDGAPREHLLACFAEGVLLSCCDTRRGALLIRRVRQACEGALADTEALVAERRLENAEQIAVAIEGLAIDRSGVGV